VHFQVLGLSPRARVAAEYLPNEEVLYDAGSATKRTYFAAASFVVEKPSSGLEPETPSLPSSNKAGIAGMAGQPW